MMYSNRLAVAIKVNGKVLREFKDSVLIPFGSEYSILIKNLNSLRCMVRVSIDGQDATEGVSLIVQPNSSIELERFIKGGNLAEGNRFKFIERTSKVEEHRGIGVEDGLVRVEYEFEREPMKLNNDWWNKQYNVKPPEWTFDTFNYPPGVRSTGNTTGTSPQGASQSVPLSYGNVSGSYADASQNLAAQNLAAPNDAGITVPGSISSQTFSLTSGFLTDGVKHVMVLKLLGETGQKLVKQAVTVKTTQKCTTCGHVNKATAKFCSGCGTGLQLV